AAIDASAPTPVDYRLLLDGLDHVLQSDPTNVEAIRARAIALVTLGRHQDALAALDHLATLVPDDLMLITTKIPLLVATGRSREVPALVRSADASVERIVEQIAQTWSGKSDDEIARRLANIPGLSDRYSARRFTEALRNDRERAARMIRADLAALEGRALSDA